MYSRELDGKELTIGVSGMLQKNALVMYDRETETLWAHFTGESLAGPLLGKQLKMIESSPRVRFGEWKKIHPNTLVLEVNGISDRNTSYPGYDKDESRSGIRPVQYIDKRLSPKTIVLGMTIGESASAIPVSVLAEKRIVNLDLGDKRVVAVGNPDIGLFGAYLVPEGVEFVRLDGRKLIAKDGKAWSLMDGAGPTTLEPVTAIRGFWFAWADHYPKTALVSSKN